MMGVFLFTFPLLLFPSCSDDPTSGNNDPCTIEEADPIADIDGNVYQTVQIGDDI